MTGPSLACRNVSFSFGEREVLSNISFAVDPGEFVAVIGPNGAGKSTLLRVLSGFFAPSQQGGGVWYEGQEVPRLTGPERAAAVGFLPQSVQTFFPFTCLEMVRMGRSVFSHWLSSKADEDERAMAALELVGMGDFADRPYPNISGGEQKLALLAKMFAQDPQVLLLDEPIATLDAGHALRVMKLLRERSEAGKAVIAVMHDLNQALAHCNRFLLLDQGRQLFYGTSAALLAGTLLQDAYGVSLTTVRHPSSGIQFLLPDHQ